jgi:hypothetical protein
MYLTHKETLTMDDISFKQMVMWVIGSMLAIIAYFVKKKIDKIDVLEQKVNAAIQNSVATRTLERYMDEAKDQRKEDHARHDRDRDYVISKMYQIIGEREQRVTIRPHGNMTIGGVENMEDEP